VEEQSQTVTINPCPNCDTDGGHVYAVPVERQLIMALIVEPPKAVIRTFRVTFMCPTNNKPFAATLRLQETSLDRIRSIGKPELKQIAEVPEEKLDE
jgi:hypothetical protein